MVKTNTKNPLPTGKLTLWLSAYEFNGIPVFIGAQAKTHEEAIQKLKYAGFPVEMPGAVHQTICVSEQCRTMFVGFHEIAPRRPTQLERIEASRRTNGA